MATIRICDWTKKVLAKDEEVYQMSIGGNEAHDFEVGAEGRDLLLKQLEGEKELVMPKTQVVYRDAPPEVLQASPPGIDVGADDPFETGPSSMPQSVMGVDDNETPLGDDEVPPIEIPAGDKRFQTTSAQRDKVIRQSRRFAAGTLPALTTGAKAQREANAKLLAEREKDTSQLNRLGGHGIKLKDLNE